MAYYHVRITPRKGASQTEVMLDLEYSEVQKRFVLPRQQGDPITINGRTFDLSEIKQIAIAKSLEKSATLIDRIERKRAANPYPSFGLDSWGIIEEAEDITNQLISGPPGQGITSDAKDGGEARPPTDTRRVFVVHGRNERAREAIFTFLRSIGLEPLEWSHAVLETKKTAPYVGEILDAAFKQAHAIVVLFTPDDEARLLGAFGTSGDPEHETELTGQARPNVLFEAGMAFGRSEERTILVELGNLRPFSDTAGRHVIRLDGSTQRRQDLANRLDSAGCPVNIKGTDWHTAGDFEAAIESVVRVQSETAEALELRTGTVQDTNLSEEAKELLKEAAKDESRFIIKTRTAMDLIIQTNRKPFGESGDMKSQAKWEQALVDLTDRGLVKRQGKGFEVTQRGFETAAVLGT